MKESPVFRDGSQAHESNLGGGKSVTSAPVCACLVVKWELIYGKARK